MAIRTPKHDFHTYICMYLCVCVYDVCFKFETEFIFKTLSFPSDVNSYNVLIINVIYYKTLCGGNIQLNFER